MRYSYYYIEELDSLDIKCDIFISAFDGCERTQKIFDGITAKKRKLWLIFPQYNINTEDKPIDYFECNELDECDYITELIKVVDSDFDKKTKICIDCTGFIIPHLLFLISKLHKAKQLKCIDIIYSEPETYANAEDTVFASIISPPEPICGFSASPTNIGGKDILIVNAGYSHELINVVAQNKDKSEYKYFFTCFPSLQADMYQQSLIQLNKCKQTIGQKNVHYHSAPAYDPFITAERIQRIIDETVKKVPDIGYIHLAPLSTKPHAIACALVYIWNQMKAPINIIYPRSQKYKLSHAVGVKRTWKYTIELP